MRSGFTYAATREKTFKGGSLKGARGGTRILSEGHNLTMKRAEGIGERAKGDRRAACALSVGRTKAPPELKRSSKVQRAPFPRT